MDEEIRRDRIIFAAAQPGNTQKIFETFKTSTEAKRAAVLRDRQMNPTEEDLANVPESEDESLRELFSQLTSTGYGVAEVDS